MKKINFKRIPQITDLAKRSRMSEEEIAEEMKKLNKPENLGSKAMEDFLNLIKR